MGAHGIAAAEGAQIHLGASLVEYLAQDVMVFSGEHVTSIICHDDQMNVHSENTLSASPWSCAVVMGQQVILIFVQARYRYRIEPRYSGG
ncbi:hypothetical protein [Actinocrispum wychmicini]|uniref:hypothetical protein n=1 Tax=Actinocrispum wychmicini TaxID=1213861 RepID=UPI001FB74F67|nr:hypothetical protein [Actinocrispum wychmicini]